LYENFLLLTQILSYKIISYCCFEIYNYQGSEKVFTFV